MDWSAIAAISSTLVALLLGLMGLLFRKSFQERDARLREQESDRLELERQSVEEAKIESESRLRLDSALKSFELIKNARNEQAPEQATGALLVLVELDQVTFALVLLEEMWPSGLVSTGASKWVIDKAFMSRDDDVHKYAARVIERKKEGFAENGVLHLPEIVYGRWPSTLDDYTKYILLLAIARSVHRVPYEDSTDIQAALITGILAMQEPTVPGALDPRQADAARFVLELGGALYDGNNIVFGIRQDQNFRWLEVYTEARNLRGTSLGTEQMKRELPRYQEWCRD